MIALKSTSPVYSSASDSISADGSVQQSHYSARAYLAGIGAKIRALNIFEPIARKVKIDQKTVEDSPTEKLYDGFVGMLCGAKGMVEVNKLVRSDKGLQQAFGRKRCAEQSVIQETLDASNADNVQQMEGAMDEIYRLNGRGYQHNYAEAIQVLDVDMSGQPCGEKADFATKGYFAGKRNRRGRQRGRVLATGYNEIIVERVYEGKVQLTQALQPLIQATAQTLEIDGAPEKRARTLVRVDSGGGSQDDVNWLLNQGYLVLTKDYSTLRARKFAESVVHWIDDPRHEGRQVGVITTPASEYDYPVVRIAVRCRKKNKQWGYGLLITNLMPGDIAVLTGVEPAVLEDPAALWLAYVYCYDQRGGGVETSFKQDNQALKIKKRNKKRFAAQQMLTQLEVLAHNVLVWAQQWLTSEKPALKQIGFVRLLRDVFTTTGELCFNPLGRLVEIQLNAADTLVRPWIQGLSDLLFSEHVAVNLGQT